MNEFMDLIIAAIITVAVAIGVFIAMFAIFRFIIFPVTWWIWTI